MLKEWGPIIISGLSLFISFIVSWNSWWRSRASIKIEQPENGARGMFLKSFDGCIESYSFKVNNTLPSFHSVILADVIITNNSSQPISILEFSIPDFPAFNSYTYTKDFFEVTYRKDSKMVIGVDTPIKYLKPEITINPYTSIRGYIFFWSGLEQELDTNNTIPLTIKTSRKEFRTKIKLKSEYDSIKKFKHISKDVEGNIIEELR